MSDRFPTSADLRDSAAQHRHLAAHFRDRDDLDARQAESYAAPHDGRARKLDTLADALDAGARIVEAGPERMCGGCMHWSTPAENDGLRDGCRNIDAGPVRAWSRASRLFGVATCVPWATPCPGFADKVTT